MENPKQPPKKRFKANKSKPIEHNSNTSESLETSEYQESELKKLKNTELKALLKKNFPTTGNKQKLISRLLDPDAAILEMKWNYHRMITNKSTMGSLIKCQSSCKCCSIVCSENDIFTRKI